MSVIIITKNKKHLFILYKNENKLLLFLYKI